MNNSDTEIRPARPADLHALQAVIQRAYRGRSGASCWSHEGEVPAGERIAVSDLAALLERDDALLSVALSGGTVVGSSLVERDEPGSCKIGLLSVDPGRQVRGIGDALLKDAEDTASARFGADRTLLEVLSHKRKLIAYYERRGYRDTAIRRPYPVPLEVPAEFVILRKDLSAEHAN